MDFLYQVWNVIFTQFLTVPALLLGTIVVIGYILLGRPATRVISGGIKTAVGILILAVGSTQLNLTFRPLLEALSKRFGITGTIIDPYAGLPAANQALGANASWVGYTILLALGVNILLVALTRFTKLRGMFLTGHIMYIQSALVTAIVSFTFKLGVVETVLIAGVLTGLYWAVGSHLLIKPVDKITNGAGFTIGHQQMYYDWIVSKTAHLIGDPEEDDAENLKLPGWLSILQDNVVNMAIIMTIFVTILMFAIGTDTIQKMSGTQHWSVYMLMTGLSFAVNVTIILTGVRMFVAELANSFKGISERLLKGAVVGVDCPALFAFSPNAWTLGFLATIIGQLVAIACLVIFRSPSLIIAGFVPLFFDGGTVGVFSNRHGGVKAIFFFGIMLGLFQVFGSALIIPLTGMVGGWMGNFDWATVWLVIATVLHFIAGLFGVGGSTVATQMAPLGNFVALFGLFLSIVVFAVVLVVRRGQQPAKSEAKLAGKQM